MWGQGKWQHLRPELSKDHRAAALAPLPASPSPSPSGVPVSCRWAAARAATSAVPTSDRSGLPSLSPAHFSCLNWRPEREREVLASRAGGYRSPKPGLYSQPCHNTGGLRYFLYILKIYKGGDDGVLVSWGCKNK